MAAMYELGASEAARRIRAGALSPSNLVAACLKRVDATEPIPTGTYTASSVPAARKSSSAYVPTPPYDRPVR